MVVCERTTSHRQLADLRNFKLSNFCYLGTRYEIGDRHRRSKHGLESGRFLFGPPIQSPLSVEKQQGRNCISIISVRWWRSQARVTRARRSLKQSFSQRPWPHGCDHAGEDAYIVKKGFEVDMRIKSPQHLSRKPARHGG